MEIGIVNLTGLTGEELNGFVSSLGQPAYRARQIFAGIHGRRLRSFDEMTDLPKELRAALGERSLVSTLTLESRYLSTDGTRRYLFKTHDHLPVEPFSFRKNVATRYVFRHSRDARSSALFV